MSLFVSVADEEAKRAGGRGVSDQAGLRSRGPHAGLDQGFPFSADDKRPQLEDERAGIERLKTRGSACCILRQTKLLCFDTRWT
jgi:hypothetical protein